MKQKTIEKIKKSIIELDLRFRIPSLLDDPELISSEDYDKLEVRILKHREYYKKHYKEPLIINCPFCEAEENDK